MATLNQTTNRAPWQERQLSYGMKMLVTFGAALLLVAALVSGITWIAVVPSQIASGPGPNDTFGSMLTGIVVVTVILIGSIAGLVMLWPFVTARTAAKPTYGMIAPLTVGHPFEVRYRRAKPFGRAMSSKGVVRFDSEGLLVNGYVTPNPLLQIGIIVALTVIPLVLFGIGLGLIPALLIAYYIGRKRIEQVFPYQSFTKVEAKGCSVKLHGPQTPHAIVFAVASVDGERLYRELAAHLPAATNGWQG